MTDAHSLNPAVTRSQHWSSTIGLVAGSSWTISVRNDQGAATIRLHGTADEAAAVALVSALGTALCATGRAERVRVELPDQAAGRNLEVGMLAMARDARIARHG